MEDKIIKDIETALNSLQKDEEQIKKEIESFKGQYQTENGILIEPKEVTQYKKDLEKIQIEINQKKLEKRKHVLLSEKERLKDETKNLKNIYRGNPNVDKMVNDMLEPRKKELETKINEVENLIKDMQKNERKNIDIDNLLKTMDERSKKHSTPKVASTEVQEALKTKLEEEIEQKNEDEQESEIENEDKENQEKIEQELENEEIQENEPEQEENETELEQKEVEQEKLEKEELNKIAIENLIREMDLGIREIDDVIIKYRSVAKIFRKAYQKVKENANQEEISNFKEETTQKDKEILEKVTELTHRKKKIQTLKMFVDDDFEKIKEIYNDEYKRKNSLLIATCVEKMNQLYKLCDEEIEYYKIKEKEKEQEEVEKVEGEVIDEKTQQDNQPDLDKEKVIIDGKILKEEDIHDENEEHEENEESQEEASKQITLSPKKEMRVKNFFSTVYDGMKVVGKALVKGGKKVKQSRAFKGIYNLLDKLADKIVPMDLEVSKEEENELKKILDEGDEEYKGKYTNKKVLNFKDKSKAYRESQKVDEKELKSKEENHDKKDKEKGDEEPEQ